MDGQTVASGSSNIPQAAFQQLLGSVSGLANGPHTAVLTNTGGGPIDIDFLDIQTQIGATGSVILVRPAHAR